MKKLFSVLILIAVFLSVSSLAYAQGTILPGTDQSVTACTNVLKQYYELTPEKLDQGISTGQISVNEILPCAVKTGNIELWMIPHFIMYMVETVLGLAGLVAVLFMVIGGYQYAIGGMTEERDKGKKTIMYALGGMVVAMLAWAIVNLIQLALTG